MRLIAAIGDSPEASDYLLNTARAQLGDSPENALQRAAAAKEIAVRRGDEVAAANAWRVQAQARRACGDHAGAAAAFESAASCASRAGDALLAAQVQVGRVDSLGWLGRIDEATALARRLEAEFRTLGEREEAAKVLVNLGSLYYRRDQYAQALNCYEAALAALAQTADPIAVARVQANCANILMLLNRADEAMALYETARSAFSAQGNNAALAMIDAAVGLLHHESGRYAAALGALSRARQEFHQRSQAVEVAKCDAEMAEAYRQMNLHPEALSCYERAIQEFSQLSIDYERARAEVGRAATLMALAQYPGALAALDQAFDLFRAQKNFLQQAHVRLVRAFLLRQIGQNEAAHGEARRALTTFARRRLYGWAAEARFLLADMALAEGRGARTMHAVCRAARQTGRGWLECRAERALGQYHASRGEAVALHHFRKGVKALEQARTLIAPEEMHVSFLSDKLAIYEDLVGALLRKGRRQDIAEALEYVERAKSRLLWERVQTAVSRRALPEGAATATQERLATLRAELSRGYHRLFGFADNEASRRAQSAGAETEALAQVEKDYHEALRDAELADPGSDRVLSELTPVVFTGALQGALQADEALVEYYVVRGAVCAFVVTSNKITVLRDIACIDVIQYVGRRLRYHLQKAGFARSQGRPISLQSACRTEEVLRQLYDLLLRPLADLLMAEKLVLVPHGSLHGLPFHAFHDGMRYALDRWEFVSAPSAALWYAGTQRHDRFEAEERSETAALLMGVSDPGLHYVATEIEQMTLLLPHATALCHEAATVEAFRKQAMGRRFIHLATHAVYRADNPLFSGLRFADGWLLARDLYEMSLDCDLATLSACQTGVANVESGDELFGLTRGFLAAGARSVAASLWPADDEATSALMQHFYARLIRGSSKAAALRAAQRQIRSEYPHPYHWAAFTLTGER